MFKTINGGKLPTKGSVYSAGVDVYANEDVLIEAGETVIVPLGIAIDENLIRHLVIQQITRWNNKDIRDVLNNFLKSHYISLKPRSSLRAKGLISHSAVIDMDYKDEIKMIIHNPDQLAFKISAGDRIGQLLLLPHEGYLFGAESNKERKGGIGSTGNK